MSLRKKPYSIEGSQRRTRIIGNIKGPDTAFFAKRNPIMKPSHPNNILRITVHNSQYDINTETLHYFFSQYGHVLRIVIFGKGGIQLPGAMVEFDSIQGATQARFYLNGFEMYQGCNKLQIEFAWTAKLFVATNDIKKSWDFTKVNYQLQPPTEFWNDGCNLSGNYAQNFNIPASTTSYYSGSESNMMMDHQLLGATTPQQQPLIVFASSLQYQPNIILVSGLNFESSNADKLFNLLSLYGNVAKIQFLPNRQGSAVVQMYDTMSAEYSIRYLNNVPIGSHGKLLVCWSDQSFQPNDSNIFMLPDGTFNFKDFTSSKNQRFLVPRPSYWIQPPSKIIRFYNTPSTISKQNLNDIFFYKNVPPKDINVLPIEDNSRLSRGLVEFNSVSQAVVAVMKCNNKEVRSKTKTIHYMKLCFSSSQTLELKH